MYTFHLPSLSQFEREKYKEPILRCWFVIRFSPQLTLFHLPFAQVIKSEEADYELEDSNTHGFSNTVVDVEHEEAGYMAHFFSEVRRHSNANICNYDYL